MQNDNTKKHILYYECAYVVNVNTKQTHFHSHTRTQNRGKKVQWTLAKVTKCSYENKHSHSSN